jgi:molecular chaperone DnaJ
VSAVTLTVHTGIDNGARLRVKGEGNAGRRGAPPGDLIVYIRVKDHPELRRDGVDIHSDIDISYVDAILGSQVCLLTQWLQAVDIVVASTRGQT